VIYCTSQAIQRLFRALYLRHPPILGGCPPPYYISVSRPKLSRGSSHHEPEDEDAGGHIEVLGAPFVGCATSKEWHRSAVLPSFTGRLVGR
jgi:hypothetical protein